ncbi:DUF2637 domain-containing protein [Gordonia alkanivorans]|uniref:DUF2637 domain-containing protein n=1 Tax=Gordonia alkanivorans TaxID=84096 RepID=UPI0024484A05|nr:DUF2637 domain-containing protein [Gordonia alkanivorans]MDH3013828.1 DUF2637 domain-containing protein [Gordonia alkanivorans]
MSDLTSRRDRPSNGSTSAASMAGAVVLSLIVVAASFTLSFNALADLARMSGAIPDSLTPLLPVCVDVFMLQATWCVYVATRRGDDAGKRYHFAMLAIFSTVSVAGNATHAFLASGHGAVHGLLAVAIAVVAPLALLASIHGLVMHVWTDTEPAAERATPAVTGDDELMMDAGSSDADRSARDAHVQVNTSDTAVVPADTSESPVGVSLSEIDAQITDDERALATYMCGEYRITSGPGAVARALACERFHVPREQMARFVGVHRTTIGRWMDLAQEYTNARHAPPGADRTHNTERVQLGERALVDAR